MTACRAGESLTSLNVDCCFKRGHTKISSHVRAGTCAHVPASVPGGGGAAGEALARSRGGLTTKSTWRRTTGAARHGVRMRSRNRSGSEPVDGCCQVVVGQGVLHVAEESCRGAEGVLLVGHDNTHVVLVGDNTIAAR